MPATRQAQSITLEAKVVRADGTVQDLGVVAGWDRSPLRRAVNRLCGRGRIHHDTTEAPMFRAQIKDKDGEFTFRGATPDREVAQALLVPARTEFPGGKVELQELVDNGDNTSTWKKA